MKGWMTAAGLILSVPAFAQSWEIHLGTGLSYCKLLPTAASFRHTSYIRYGLIYGGLYVSPELRLNADDHQQFCISYQYSDNSAGLRFRSTGTEEVNSYQADLFSLHSFAVGYRYNASLANNKLQLGVMAAAGLAFGYASGEASGGSSAGFDPNSSYVVTSIKRTGNNGISALFWTPNTTAAITLSPNLGGRVQNKLSLQISSTICWKDVYDQYSTISYIVTDDANVKSGEAKYRGRPLLFQAGIDYRLCRILHDR